MGRADDSQLSALDSLSYATETVLRFPTAALLGSLSPAITRSNRSTGYVGQSKAIVWLAAAGASDVVAGLRPEKGR